MKKLLSIISVVMALATTNLHALPVGIIPVDNVLYLRAKPGCCGAVRITMKNIDPELAKLIVFKSSLQRPSKEIPFQYIRAFHGLFDFPGKEMIHLNGHMSIMPNFSWILKFDDGGCFIDGYYLFSCHYRDDYEKLLNILDIIDIEPLGTAFPKATAPGDYEPCYMNHSNFWRELLKPR